MNLDNKQQNLFEKIGRPLIERAVSLFYERAFVDGMIGHFFFLKDHQELIAKQIQFTSALLGGEVDYEGRPLALIHHPLPIRPPHFMRRQKILEEVLVELNLDTKLIDEWLAREQKLKPLILNRLK